MFAVIRENLSCSNLAIRIAALQIIQPDSSLSGICSDQLENEIKKVLNWIENMPLQAGKSFAWEIVICEQG